MRPIYAIFTGLAATAAMVLGVRLLDWFLHIVDRNQVFSLAVAAALGSWVLGEALPNTKWWTSTGKRGRKTRRSSR